MGRISRRRALALGAGAAINAVLVACGNGDDDDAVSSTSSRSTTRATGSRTTVPATASTAPATSVPAGPEGAPPIEEYDLGATLRLGYAAPPTRFDPHRSSSSYDNNTLQVTYDRLFHLTPEGLPGPGLATGWEFGDGGAHLDLTLRDGVRFHDGTPFDADAVKANIERAQTLEGSAVAAELAMITAVEVLAPDRVRLQLGAPAAHLPAVLSDRPGMMISPAAFDKPDLDVAPVGAGMYRVASYEEGIAIVFERFEDYWDPDSVRCARIEWSITPDSTTRFNALQSGQIDAAVISPQDDARAESAGFHVVRRGGVEFFHVHLNRSYEPFADADVRRALNHAIDRQAIVDTLYSGLAVPNGQPFPEGYFAYDPETGSDPYPYDPERARQLLADAGYADGFEFEMLFQISALMESVALAIQAQLAEVGITVHVRPIEPVQAGDIFYVRQESNALAAMWGGRADPTQTLRLLYSAEGFSNPGRHTTPEMTAAIEATAAVQTQEERIEACRRASAQVVADALDVVLYYPITSYAFSERVLGADAMGPGRPEFRYVGIRKEEG